MFWRADQVEQQVERALERLEEDLERFRRDVQVVRQLVASARRTPARAASARATDARDRAPRRSLVIAQVPSPRARRASFPRRACARARSRRRRCCARATDRRGSVCARSRIGCCSRMIASITGCLHSRQPMPAVVQPCHTQSRVVLVRIDLVQPPHRAFLRIAGIGAPHARRIGLHRADLLRHRRRLLAQQDRVAVRLRHLLAVEARHARRFGQQRLRLGQDHAARAFEIAEQPLAIAERQVLRVLEQRRAPPRAPACRPAPGTRCAAPRSASPSCCRASSPRRAPCPRSRARGRRCG